MGNFLLLRVQIQSHKKKKKSVVKRLTNGKNKEKRMNFLSIVNSGGAKIPPKNTRPRAVMDKFSLRPLTDLETEYVDTLSAHMKDIINVLICVLPCVLICGVLAGELYLQIIEKWEKQCEAHKKFHKRLVQTIERINQDKLNENPPEEQTPLEKTG